MRRRRTAAALTPTHPPPPLSRVRTARPHTWYAHVESPPCLRHHRHHHHCCCHHHRLRHHLAEVQVLQYADLLMRIANSPGRSESPTYHRDNGGASGTNSTFSSATKPAAADREHLRSPLMSPGTVQSGFAPDMAGAGGMASGAFGLGAVRHDVVSSAPPSLLLPTV